MSEHHPDMDRIMALAAGRLPPDEAARIEAALTDDARRELAAQRAALAALGQLPRPTMSADERRRLRATVRTELRLEGIRPPSSDGQQHRSRRSWLAIALPSLVAVASVVAVIGIALNLTDGADEESADAFATTGAPATTAAEAPQPTATPATTTLALDRESLDTSTDMTMPAEEAMMQDSEGPEDTGAAAATAPTTAPAAPTSGGRSEAVLPESAGLAFDFSTDRPDEAFLFTATAFMDGDEDPFPVSQLPERAARAGLVCWENAAVAAEPENEVSFMAHGLIDGAGGEAYRIEEASAEEEEPGIEEETAGIIHLFAYPDCRPLTFSFP